LSMPLTPSVILPYAITQMNSNCTGLYRGCVLHNLCFCLQWFVMQ
jgi:hypothetical protein